MRTASRAELPGHDPMPVARTAATGGTGAAASATGLRHGDHRCTRLVTDAGTVVPASTDHGAGSGSPATTRNGTTPDHAWSPRRAPTGRRTAP